MVKITTHNIEISVESSFHAQHSVPGENHYFFIYFVTIINHSDYSVQLLKRHWDIFDSNGEKHTIDGDGVVGETPTIKPGGQFKYNSGCNLNSEIGYMKGFYTLKDILTGKQFDVQIPKFDLIVPAKLN